MTGPFEAGVRVGGEEIRGGLADLSLDLLRRCAPVRSPAACQRRRHMPGRWFSTTAGRFLEYESLLERDWMLLMDFDREIEWVCEQPVRLSYRKDDKPASHVPDLVVWRAGAPELCDVKSVERPEDAEFQAQVRATGLACAEAGFGYRVLAESSDVRKMQFRARVASRLARESGEPLELPSSRQTFNRIVDEVLRSTGLFRLPAKSRRSAQSAPSEGLGSLIAERPGEYVAIDTTSLDVFAIDPFTFQWVGLDLTAARVARRSAKR